MDKSSPRHSEIRSSFPYIGYLKRIEFLTASLLPPSLQPSPPMIPPNKSYRTTLCPHEPHLPILHTNSFTHYHSQPRDLLPYSYALLRLLLSAYPQTARPLHQPSLVRGAVGIPQNSGVPSCPISGVAALAPPTIQNTMRNRLR